MSLASTPQKRKPVKFDPLRPIRQFPGIAALLFKRQRHYSSLTLLALLDVILAVGLVTNASFFSQAVDRVVLLDELKQFTQTTGRPPFSTAVYVFPSSRSPLTLQGAEDTSQKIASTLTSQVGLPLRHLGLQVSSGGLMLLAPPGSNLASSGKSFLGSAEAAYIADIGPQMDIIDGQPMDSGKSSGAIVDVWVHEHMMQQMGLNLGDNLNLGINQSDPNPIQMHIAGVWKAKDPKAEFWFNDPDTSLDKYILFRRDDYVNAVQARSDTGGVKSASWYVILDDHALIPTHSAQYLAGFERGNQMINQFLPGAQLNSPPLEPLRNFLTRSTTMTTLLLAYNLPAFGILLYFLVLTSTTIAAWQKREMSLFVSRGMSVNGVLNLILVEQLILFVIGYPIGLGLGMLLAYAMGYTASFLSFTTRSPLPVSLQGLSLQLTVVALGISLFARLWPALKAARSSLVAQERERARPVNQPFWYRFYLDIVLLVPTGYAYSQLAQRGSIAGLIETKAEDLYRDPLLILVPALFVVTISLVTMRLFHLLMRLVDAAAAKAPWLSIHLALRQLGRQSLDYVTPLLLVIISLAMGVYTLSMAGSLDQWLVDRMYYQAGSDLNITPLPPGTDSSSANVPVDGTWIPLPGNFTSVPGVAAAARVGTYPARIVIAAGQDVPARFMAVDRAEFASASWWRSDFANEPLGSLMNRLAYSPDSILVSQKFIDDTHLNVGDQVDGSIQITGADPINVQLTIVGVYKYFPTVQVDQTVTVVGNMDFLVSWLGYTMPHNIWLRLQPGADPKTVLN